MSHSLRALLADARTAWVGPLFLLLSPLGASAAGLYVNTWVSERTLPKAISLQLEAERRYYIHVQFSSGPVVRNGVVSESVAGPDADSLVAALKKGAYPTVRVALIHDAVFLVREGPIVLEVALGDTAPAWPADPAGTTTGMPTGMSDARRFEVRSKSELPPGAARFSLSLWHETKPQLVHELAVGLCVGGYVGCTGLQSRTYGLSGTDSLRDGTTELGGRPDAALTFLELGKPDDPVVGIFQINNPAYGNTEGPSTFVWDVGRSLKELLKLAGDMSESFDKTEQQRVDGGRSLFGALFPSNEKGKLIRAQFIKVFDRASVHKGRFAQTTYPSLSIRFVSSESGDLRFYPLGLLNVPSDAFINPRQHDLAFLGYYFRLDMPLPVQQTQFANDCISNWYVLGPPNIQDEKDPLGAAYKAIRPDFVKVSISGERAFDIGAGGLAEIRGVDQFILLMEDMRRESQPTLIATLAHHDRNSVYFSPAERQFASTRVGIHFEKASAAILNACKTSGTESYSSDFIKTFNERGVSSIIATSRSVEGRLAGLFSDCFLENVHQAVKTNRGTDMASLYAKTLRCVTEKVPEIGSRALSYMLLGDSRVKLCADEGFPR